MSIKKRIRRFLGITFATLMMVCSPLSAFAANNNTAHSEVSNVSADEPSLAAQGPIVSGTVGINSQINLYPYLEQGSIFGRTICIRTSSSSTSGVVYLYLYNRKGELVSNDWIMGVSDSMNKYIPLPDYGTYTLKVLAQVNNQPVTVDAWWQ